MAPPQLTVVDGNGCEITVEEEGCRDTEVPSERNGGVKRANSKFKQSNVMTGRDGPSTILCNDQYESLTGYTFCPVLTNLGVTQ
ncbi:hypothetical protein Csa_010793 [Cucumis sativus]|nr:hypothetical protein Csa_010793 [Cucumis sativus]